MPTSATTTQPTSAAPHSLQDPDHAEASDAETEPLPYDDPAIDDGQHSDIVMDPSELAHHTAAAAAAAATDLDAPGEEVDESMLPPLDHAQSSSHPHSAHEAHDDDEDAPADEDHDDDDDDDDIDASQATVAHDPNSNISSPQKAGAFTGDEFSDESELTDEDEDQNDDADASSLSDDDLGGSEDDDEDDDDDGHSKTHEDEAAEALAALTGGAEGADDDANAGAAAGLDALAALATAGVNGDAAANAQDDDDDDDEDEDDDASDADADDAAAEEGTSRDDIAKHGRLHQLQQEADADDLSSDITPEPEDDVDADGHAGADEISDHEDPGSPRTTDLDLIASMKKRAAATGGATSLLEPEQLVDSLPGSAASSRAASPLADDDEDDADKPKPAGDAEADADVKAADADHADADQLDTAAGTPAPDAVEPDEDASTDEAAIRRQEAMEALTKIEIGFAMLRDRLYVERLQEISKEGEMIVDGTHPELLHLNKAIESRRQRRTQLVDMWFEQQEQQYERVANAEEFAAWSIWRSSCASLRRDMMDDFSRKRRRLDREKRTLDAPRPARRHQIFETELVRDPDRVHIPLPSAAADTTDRANPNASRTDRQQSAKRKAIAREIERGDEFVAYPDLKGLAEVDVMMDIEQMGIRPAGVPPGMYDPFYGAPVGLEFQNPDVYAMYGPEAAAAAAAAAQAQMNGFPYGLPPGARGMPGPHPGMIMGPGTPHRHGMHPLPPPPGHMHPGMEMGMMGFDPYAAAEMERAARMHHREQAARMGMDPNDPHHRSSPFRPDMYAPYPPQYGMPPGPPGPGPMGVPPRGAAGNMPGSPTPPHRGGGRKDRASVDDSVGVSGRGRGAAKTAGRSNKSRSGQAARDAQAGLPPAASPSHSKSGGAKTSLPPPPSMAAGMGGAPDERDVKMHANGTAHQRPPQHGGAEHKPAGSLGAKAHAAPAATPVADAASMGVGNARLYPPSSAS
ncbi:uncharacterized protein PAN0_017c5455 [Moesziomyces antarcticus]|uniref:Uncharacterized protein n=2 Tax=Pseudozyma antarctica TaxID=84753 RepID=A0A081CKN3_PSEA2|nr:uncharacterized protein PAN0_017c5455 [Moesziomyces antarcticus]GAK67229.1 conserved hypothetical protein [Moesziomyces antarcticus]SPO48163.1 uncharacterized protein PSANT_05851 [Moesziomyces antarcticus]